MFLIFAALERLSTVKESPENQRLALERQHNGNEQLAKALGGTVGKHYCDPDKSAYKEGVVRPEFDKCLAELDQYDGMLAADLDRVSRDPAIGEVIIARVRQCPVPVIYTRNPESASGYEAFDLSTERGREAFRTNIIAIRREARKASERQAARHAQARDAGKPVGARAFGEKEGKLALDDKEAAIIRQGARDLLAGKSVWQLAKEWEAAGVKGSRGTPMTRSSIRNMYLSPRLAGWRLHQPPYVKGQAPIPRSQWIAKDSLTGLPIKSLTPAILLQEEWEAVCDELEGRKAPQVPRQSNTAKYLLSGLVYCATCASAMCGQWVKRYERHVYRCPTGCGVIHGPELDAQVTRLLLAHWAQAPQVVAEPKPFGAQAELDRLEAQVEALRAAWAAGSYGEDLAEYQADKAPLLPQVAALKAQRKEWLQTQLQARPVGTEELWQRASVQGKRLMARQEIERVKVGRARRGLKAFQPERVAIDWR